MCLRVKRKKFLGIRFPIFLPIKTASEDIVCYKLLKNFKGKLESDIQFFSYELNKLYEAKITFEKNWHFKVNEGFHSWQSFENIPCYSETYGAIVKCIIPRGAKYVKGIQYDGNKGYVSNQIIIKEII